MAINRKYRFTFTKSASGVVKDVKLLRTTPEKGRMIMKAVTSASKDSVKLHCIGEVDDALTELSNSLYPDVL